jgi:hypothetical protein
MRYFTQKTATQQHAFWGAVGFSSKWAKKPGKPSDDVCIYVHTGKTFARTGTQIIQDMFTYTCIECIKTDMTTDSQKLLVQAALAALHAFWKTQHLEKELH